MKFEHVKAIADGKVWTGQQALSMKLIDQLADFEAAVDDTAKSVRINGEPVLVRPEKDRKTLVDLLFGDVSEWIPTREKLMDQHVGFYYCGSGRPVLSGQQPDLSRKTCVSPGVCTGYSTDRRSGRRSRLPSRQKATCMKSLKFEKVMQDGRGPGQ